MSEIIILMSIKPYFAEKILNGEKRFELRKKLLAIPEHSRIILYASSPLKAIIGEFIAGRVIEGPPDHVWELVSRIPHSGVEPLDWPYIKGARRALAIEVTHPIRYPSPLSLTQIRNHIPNFRPPLSYRYLPRSDTLVYLINKLIARRNSRGL